MAQPIVVKLGGDALASPQRIVAQARRLARWAGAGPIVVVASARRGVTDHLVSLVDEVRSTIGPDGPNLDGGPAAAEEADRALASGEVVSAALLALALNRLGIRAASLDAREAGVLVEGPSGEAWIKQIHTERTEQLLAEGVIPVVTGFQGWRQGRVATLGRGGSDTTAVALAVALNAGAVRLVKEAAGLRTADPKIVQHTTAIREAPHRFLTALTRAGSKVVHPDAAELAERHQLRLEFWSLDGEHPETLVHAGAVSDSTLRATTLQPPHHQPVTVSVLGVALADLHACHGRLTTELQATGLHDVTLEDWSHGFRLQAPAQLAGEAVKVLHRVVVQGEPRGCDGELCAS